MDKHLIWVLAFSVGICTVLLHRSLMPATILVALSAITNKGILTALAVGEQSGIDSETRQLLRESGLSHLVAISGLHIGLAGLFAYGIASGLWRVFPWGC